LSLGDFWRIGEERSVVDDEKQETTVSAQQPALEANVVSRGLLLYGAYNVLHNVAYLSNPKEII
jgi:hypothetical protein